MAGKKKSKAKGKATPAARTTNEPGLFAQIESKYRYQLAPLYVIVAVWFLGAMAHQAPDGRTWIIGGAVVVGGLALITRPWVDRDIERIYVLVGLLVVTVWLLVAATWGTTKPINIAWLILGLLGSLPWWTHFRGQVRIPDRPHLKINLGEQVETWDQYVAQPGQALPGSTLTGVTKIKHGWAATIVLPRGAKSTDDAIDATARVTSAFGMPVGSVSIEATADGIASHARMTVLETNPLHNPQPFKAPSLDPETGLAAVGVYGDGELAHFRFWMPHSGPVHSLVSGTTGSGKSRFLDQILAEARHSGLIVTWMIDPQGGQSLPRWVDSVDWAALSSDEGLGMLQAAHDVMHARSRYMARLEYVDDKGRQVRGIDFFDPTPQFPLLMLVIEEAHDITRKPTSANGPVADRDNPVKLIEDIGKMGRKCGVFVVLATQMPSVAELGNSSVLRSMVSSGNVVVFRTSDRLSGGMAFSGSLPVDPSAIQRSINGKSSGGMGFIVGSGSRTAMMRAFFVEDPYEWATTGEPATLDELSAAAAGDAYAASQNRTESGTVLAAIERGPLTLPDTHDEVEDGWSGLDSPILTEPLDLTPAYEASQAPQDVSTPPPLVPAPANAPEAVYAALVKLGGSAKTLQLIDETGYKTRTITDAVSKLEAAGTVQRLGRGHYAVVQEEGAPRPE